jgi:hypothetical protein
MLAYRMDRCHYRSCTVHCGQRDSKDDCCGPRLRFISAGMIAGVGFGGPPSRLFIQMMVIEDGQTVHVRSRNDREHALNKSSPSHLFS